MKPRYIYITVMGSIMLIAGLCGIEREIGRREGASSRICSKCKRVSAWASAGTVIVTPTPSTRPLTSQWHKEEELKIDLAVMQLRHEGKWNERWDKFSKLGDYDWRSGMDCGDGTKPIPCMSGGYTFSQVAFDKLKRGDLSHDARNTPEEAHRSFRAVTTGR